MSNCFIGSSGMPGVYPGYFRGGGSKLGHECSIRVLCYSLPCSRVFQCSYMFPIADTSPFIHFFLMYLCCQAQGIDL